MVSILRGEIVATKPEQNKCLHQILEQLLDEDTSIQANAALLFQRNKVTFGELNKKANQVARYLLQHWRDQPDTRIDLPGVKIVAVCVPPSDNLIILLLAILKLGAAYLPLDTTFPPMRIAHIVAESHPLCVVTENVSKTLVEEAAMKITDFTVDVQDLQTLISDATSGLDDSNLKDSERASPWKVNERTVACVYYTSGSTGTPKGVMLPHDVILNRIRWQWRVLPFTDEEIVCFKTVLVFVDAISEIFAALLAGRPLLIIPRATLHDPAAFIAELEWNRVRRLVAVPSLIRSLLLYIGMHPQRTFLPQLELLVSSGEVLTEYLLRDIFSVFPSGKTVIDAYGSTEVIADVIYSIFRSTTEMENLLVDGKVPIGIPLDNNNIYIVNENMEVVPLGEIGEVVVSGAHVSLGYLGKKEDPRFCSNTILPEEPQHSVIYKTGDYGRIVNDMVIFEGRKDTQIKVRGQRVDLTEIDGVIAAVPGISKGIVLCYKPGEPSQTIVGFFTSDSPLVSEASVTEYLRQCLAPYMVPYMVQIDKVPLLPNGKVDRQSLLRYFEALTAVSEDDEDIVDVTGVEEEYRAPATALLVTAASVLGHSRCGPLTVDCNFFDVGGNSLNAVLLVSKLRKKGYAISVTDFLRSKTFRLMLKHVEPTEAVVTTKEQKTDSQETYSIVSLKDVPREVGIQITADSFALKGDLEKYTGTTVDEFKDYISRLWQYLIAADLSFGVQNSSEEVVAISLNFDARNEPEHVVPLRSIKLIMDFLADIERPHLARLPEGKRAVFHAIMLGTAAKVGAAENICLVQVMENENIRRAKEQGYKVILTSNTNQLTQDLGDGMFGYEVMEMVQANLYVNQNNERVFEKAPDSITVQIACKFL